MTAVDRLEVLDARVTGALDEIAAPSRPDYLDDIFTVTARARQRPRWTFLERWLPMDTAVVRPAGRLRVPLRPLVLLLILAALLVAASAILVGSQRRVPPPYGLAGNGNIVYGAHGDLFVRDSLTDEPRLLVGGPGDQAGALFSFDGQLVAYDNVVDGVDHVSVANADGSNPRVILGEPFTGLTAAWSPDSRSMVLMTDNADGSKALWIAAADGSGAREVKVDGVAPLEAVYNPADDGSLLIRGLKAGYVDLYLINLDGRVLRSYGLQGGMLYGPDWELAGLAFSPDGQTIAHNVVLPQDRFGTDLIDVDGSNERVVPRPVDARPDYSQAWPVFSPDGRWIAMESWVGAIGGRATNQLAIAPADGSAPAHGVGPALPNQSLRKAWSPDGTKLLAAASDINIVYEIDPITGESSKLPWSSDTPDWQRVAR